MDIEKIQKARKGDDRSFYELISERKELLYKTAFLYVKNEQDAMDIVGETVFHAYRSIRKLNHPEYFSTWLIKILINQALVSLRKAKPTLSLERENELALGIPGPSVEDKLDLLGAVEKLSDPYKTVIILKYIHDLPNHQIAEVLATPIGTIKTHLHRAIKQLRMSMLRGEINNES
ncbi:sigma-70 family RNA polymerase sigma factor [Paenibacillus chitinolyticus]|uniref:sigma-70 family RNA polymerase sigma factor n=1 Tax=Paenibacillus chitinolyticus TaxID=79263 RepID=UPI002DB8BEC4|nr:sigma-70 family RNA polymerase sigma factor [Paenibacillus chitinolyticus]MEC0245909.1 sigma-70 family RNA polymerase sigma factor [Paenibacillus chitinolyticus]